MKSHSRWLALLIFSLLLSPTPGSAHPLERVTSLYRLHYNSEALEALQSLPASKPSSLEEDARSLLESRLVCCFLMNEQHNLFLYYIFYDLKVPLLKKENLVKSY